MKLSFLFSFVILFSSLGYSLTVIEKPAGSLNKLPLDGHPEQILYSWQLVDLQRWTSNSYARSLIPEFYVNQPKKEDLKIFEARAVFVFPFKREKLNAESLHTIDVVRSLDPQNNHNLIGNGPLRVRSKLMFPSYWATLIETAKQINQLKPENQPYLEMTSTFAWFDEKTIAENPAIQQIVKQFNLSDKKPLAINLQEISDINEIAQFGNIATLFYETKPNIITAFTFCIFGLEKDVLRMGVQRLDVTAEGILLGKYPQPINTDTGIGAGLPQYVKELLTNMRAGLQKTLY